MTHDLAPIEEFERSPDRIDEVEGVLTPSRIDLRELPVGTVFQFYGMHLDSRYICLIDSEGEDKKVKIWLKGNGNGAIGDLESLASLTDYGREREEAVLEVGAYYMLPEFRFREGGVLWLTHDEPRYEAITKIFVLEHQS